MQFKDCSVKKLLMTPQINNPNNDNWVGERGLQSFFRPAYFIPKMSLFYEKMHIEKSSQYIFGGIFLFLYFHSMFSGLQRRNS